MNFRKSFYFISLLLALVLFMPYQGWSQLFPFYGVKPKPEGRGPIITHAFAVTQGYYGYIWKIYIEAEDPDGDMLKIASVVEQPGYGTYPTDWIYLKPQYQKSFKGYVQWNTFSSKTAYIKEWTEITLKVSVFDRAGNVSNEVVFPFTFESGTKSPYQYKLPDPFDQGNLPRLGYIHIDLFEPTQMGDGDGGGGGQN